MCGQVWCWIKVPLSFVPCFIPSIKENNMLCSEDPIPSHCFLTQIIDCGWKSCMGKTWHPDELLQSGNSNCLSVLTCQDFTGLMTTICSLYGSSFCPTFHGEKERKGARQSQYIKATVKYPEREYRIRKRVTWKVYKQVKNNREYQRKE